VDIQIVKDFPHNKVYRKMHVQLLIMQSIIVKVMTPNLTFSCMEDHWEVQFLCILHHIKSTNPKLLVLFWKTLLQA